ncbi:uncharacterized protein LOC121367447 [Gigantopelta aegis]|uniref:uncharacterized protein LOC121367447 n=1 Tax=Gigantopelta aegis TaxID=1735272 RepID=UPI001B88909D|nr:uncharacterized protein LOC121367447 [Gigantopelta aegis]
MFCTVPFRQDVVKQVGKWMIFYPVCTICSKTALLEGRTMQRSESSDFPLKFCKHRWLENGPVSRRAISIWESMKTYVTAVDKKKVSRPANKSYSVVSGATKDPLIIAKLSFFNSVSREVEPFLKQYQTDKVMIPFLVSDLEKLMRNLMERFIEGGVLEAAQSVNELLKIDLSKNTLNNKDIQIGYKAASELKKLKSSKAISGLQAFEFRDQCKKLLVKLVEKVNERSPLKYSIARNLSRLDPRLIVKQGESSKLKMRRLLELLVKLNRVHEDDVDDLNCLYSELFRDVVSGDDLAMFRDYDVEEGRVDTLLYETMGTNKRYGRLWKEIRKMLLLSHGQASMERGFSVNRQIEMENMSGGMNVALRTISDYLSYVGGIFNVNMTKQLLCSVLGARHRYHQYLEEEKRKKCQEVMNLKRKAATDEIDLLRKKSKTLDSDICALEKSAVSFADQAEKTQGAKSNAMRRSADEKKADLKLLLSDIDYKTKQLG